MTETCYKYGKTKSHWVELQEKTGECTAILDAKRKYARCISNKLNDPLTAPKTYWSKLNRFLNNRKPPATLHLLVNGDIITNVSEKAELFCRPMFTP